MPIVVQGLSFSYSKGTPFEKRALDNVSLTINDGEFVGIMGHTGSGKSTFIQHLNGLIKVQEGSVEVDGIRLTGAKRPKPDYKKLRAALGMVFQYPEYQLFEDTCEKDIAFGPRNMGLSDEEIRERVKSAAEFVGLDSSLLKKSPFELSGGQKRRVALAGVMAMEPSVLVLDEPAAGLDPIGRTEIFGGIRGYQRAKGNTVIIVSHSMEDVAEYCDNLTVLKNGRVLLKGSTGEVFMHEKELIESGLGVPQITRFVRLLREEGIDLPENIYTVEEALREVKRLLGERRGDNA